MYKVAVLMSTYNGEKYITKQIDSILAQNNVAITLFIRDDGSSDSTVGIMQTYLKDNSNIKLDIAKNIGVGNSFMQLIYDVGDEFDYYAFADQDDVWLSEKLIKAIVKIEPYNIPTLYVSNQILVDSKLQKIGMRFDSDPDVTYKQTMCQNKATGCTMVWNKQLHKMLSEKKRRPAKELLNRRIHDVWVSMVAGVIGKVIYDSNGYILYRQHTNNVVGVRKTNIINQWIKKLGDKNRRNGRSLLCKEIIRNYQDVLDGETRSVMQLYANYNNSLKNKYRLITQGNITQYTGESQFGFALKVMLGLV